MHDLEERLAAVMGSVPLLVTPCTLAQLEYMGATDTLCRGQPNSPCRVLLMSKCALQPVKLVQQSLGHQHLSRRRTEDISQDS